MVSKTTLVLAIAIPLALLCIATFGAAAFLLHSLNQLKAAHRHSVASNTFTREISRVQLPGFSRHQINMAFTDFVEVMGDFLRKWVHLDEVLSSHKHSTAQIEAILSPLVSEQAPMADGEKKVSIIFTNPHLYTPDEICSAFESPETRIKMLEYILTSALLESVSLQGDPSNTLLPFAPEDVSSLNRLHKAIQSLDLSQNVQCHIANFWMRNVNENLSSRSQYHKLVDSLLDPYLPINGHISLRHKDFDKVIDKAVEFGKKVTGQCPGSTMWRWGKRDDVAWFRTSPMLLDPALCDVDRVSEGVDAHDTLDNR
ncbi:hypothetical protein VTL71DRAFT_4377 [Oculimacula yallundae]|uniref:Uncharacterized protein n=1 Tax=Oculimacula yallundae TaxID=86028 RepID=A0ABR4C1R7_9HELO